MITDIVLNHPEFAGIHYTGGTGVFQNIWKKIGENIHKYKTYPKIVGETGGKDFVFAHPTAKVDALVTAIIRGAFEFQGHFYLLFFLHIFFILLIILLIYFFRMKN